eukprot:GEMP01035295.1.p1 GENE.GEMP01035295.1~~GEMP01035295.1.p1  ORF type:complete len:361 (+),score=84.19 GEMP01035295.1:232-1314(+)
MLTTQNEQREGRSSEEPKRAWIFSLAPRASLSGLRASLFAARTSLPVLSKESSYNLPNIDKDQVNFSHPPRASATRGGKRFSPNSSASKSNAKLKSAIQQGDDTDNVLETMRWTQRSKQESRTYQGHEGSVLDVAVCPSGQSLYTASADTTVRRWDVESATCTMTYTHPSAVHWVSTSRDGKYIYTTCWPGRKSDHRFVDARQIDADTGVVISTTSSHRTLSAPVSFSPDGRYMYTVVQDFGERFDLHADNNCIAKYPPLGKGGVHDILVSNCGRYVFTLENAEGHDGVGKSYEVDSTRCLHTFTGHRGKVLSMAQSPRGDFLFTCGEDKTARMYHTDFPQLESKAVNPAPSYIHSRELI